MTKENLNLLNYIHRSKKGVYKTFGNDIVNRYKKEREFNYLQMMSRFKQNYISSISKTPEELLNAALKQDQLIKEIDKNSLKFLQDTFSKSLEQIFSKNITFGQEARIYGAQYVQQYLQNSNSLRARENFSKMFENIAKAAEIVYGDESILAHILQSTNTYGEIKTKLQQTRFKINNKFVNINNTEERKAIQYLNNLINATESKTLLKKDGTLNKDSLRSSFNNIFSTNFGESLFKSLIEGNPDIYKNIIEEVNNIGTENVDINFDPKLLNLAQRGSQVYKVDSQLKNFKININVNKTKAQIVLNIGTSIKNYQSNTSTIDISGEKSLTHRLQQMFKNKKSLSLANNIFANRDIMMSEYSALKSNISAYFADIFISGIGVKGDFSQYLIINGRFYSIYDILLKLKKQDEDIITFTPTGITKLNTFQDTRRQETPNDLQRAYVNSKQSMELLNGLELNAKFRPNKYSALI